MSADAKDNSRANHRVGPLGGAANVGLTVNVNGTTYLKVYRGGAAVTLDGTSQVIDLVAWFGQDCKDYFLRMICDQDFYYYYSNDPADTVSSTAVATTTASTGVPNSVTGAATYGDLWKANTRDEECPAARYLIIKSAAAATLRMWLTNARLLRTGA